jgi:hypothetical protein
MLDTTASILSYTAFLEGATVVTQFQELQYAVSLILDAVRVPVQVVYQLGLEELYGVNHRAVVTSVPGAGFVNHASARNQPTLRNILAEDGVPSVWIINVEKLAYIRAAAFGATVSTTVVRCQWSR